MIKTKSSEKKVKHRDREISKDKKQVYGRNITRNPGPRECSETGVRDSPRMLPRRPLITMRGPTLSSIEGELELLRAEWVETRDTWHVTVGQLTVWSVPGPRTRLTQTTRRPLHWDSSPGCSGDLLSPSRPPSAPAPPSPAQSCPQTESPSTSPALHSQYQTSANISSGNKQAKWDLLVENLGQLFSTFRCDSISRSCSIS